MIRMVHQFPKCREKCLILSGNPLGTCQQKNDERREAVKWKKQVWIVDDIISKEQQENIKSTLLAYDFSWGFIDNITSGALKEKRPAFGHTFVRDGMLRSREEYIKLLEPLWGGCMEKIKRETNVVGNYAFVQARTFLQLALRNVRGGEYDAHHIDLADEHFALLYYVCDSDGDTVIFENMYSKENPKPPEPRELIEKARVTPKQGRVVIFDGYYWHTATQPSKGIRCIINTDVVQRA